MEEITIDEYIQPKSIKKINPICEHNKIKYICKECGGSSICIHGKRKTYCKDCKGASICEHNRIKFNCKDCKGTSICEHNKRKSICKDCDGTFICKHGRQKSQCKDCNGISFCEHNRIKSTCRHCSGASICEHNKRKSICKDCGGASICEHSLHKTYCKECGGSSICEHNKSKSRCKECKGSSICKHGKEKSYCSECGGSQLCISCKLKLKSKKYDNHCLRCFIYLFPDKPVIRNYKTKETATAQFITTNFPNFTWSLDKKVEDGCSRRRPDLMCDLGYQVIIVEVDENQHIDYDCSCENKRIMQLSQDLEHRPIVFIRFNPDDYINSNSEKITSCWGTTPKTGIIKIKNNKINEWNERLEALKGQIEYWSNEENKTEKTIEIIQLFYNM